MRVEGSGSAPGETTGYEPFEGESEREARNIRNIKQVTSPSSKREKKMREDARQHLV